MPNIKLTLQYDGTRYLGWTRPAADGYAKTISYRISSVLQKMTGEDITLFAGAKTAPGVHALCQTVNFHTESPFSDTYFLSKLNEYLPKDIHILSSEIVSDRFRSDLNAVSRTYLYRICTALLEEKQNLQTRIDAAKKEAANRINEDSRMAEYATYLEEHLNGFPHYDDEVVRKMIERVTVVDSETIRVKFRYSDLEIEQTVC